MTYRYIMQPRQGLRFDIVDSENNRVCISHDEFNANKIVRALNAEADTERKQNMLYRTALQKVVDMPRSAESIRMAVQALAATADLKDAILCNREPVVWMQSTYLSVFTNKLCGSAMMLSRCSDHKAFPDFKPLHTPWEPK